MAVLSRPQGMTFSFLQSLHWQRYGFLALLWAGFAVLFSGSLSVEMKVASFAYALMISGLWFRKQRKLHVFLMGTAIVTDISLVLALEWNRSAVEKVVKLSITALQAVHVGSSTAATVLYIPILVLGFLRWRGTAGRATKRWHAGLGVTAFVLRTIGFLFMFSFLK